MSKSVQTAEKPPTPPARIKPIEPRRVADPQFGWRVWEATVPADSSLETILSGDFWRLTARRFQRGDHIEWRNDSLTRFGELIIVSLDVATGKSELRELWTKDVTPVTLPETERSGFTARDLGVHDGWGIVRDEDGLVLAKNIGSYDEAQRRIKVEFIQNRNALAATEGHRQ